MKTLTLYYATNRAHEGTNRWKPDRYGTKFSDDGAENLRFGKVTVEADEAQINKCLSAASAGTNGDGEKLGAYLARQAKANRITAFREVLTEKTGEKDAKLGSAALFAEVKAIMDQATDVLVYIHGFNVSWEDAVGSALALQLMLNQAENQVPSQSVQVVLFTWPSDGMALPWVSYKSDRTEASASGYAIGRGFLKLRDFLASLRDRASGVELCGQDIHLLCHSMGNFVLQNALGRMSEFTPGTKLPKIFEHIFLCAPDVDDNALEPDQPMGDVQELASYVSVYHNRGDLAMFISDYTKGHPERLGGNGAARPALLHNKVNQLDCTAVVTGIVEHSYYLCGLPNRDIRLSIAGCDLGDPRRNRVRDADLPNVWRLPKL
jgi:esterase/lipase superfamily enzyme